MHSIPYPANGPPYTFISPDCHRGLDMRGPKGPPYTFISPDCHRGLDMLARNDNWSV